MLKVDTELKNSFALAIDAESRRVAIAQADGALTILETQSRNGSAFKPQVIERPWTDHEVIPPTAESFFPVENSICLDSKGRLCLLAVFNRPTDYRDEGELHFLRYDGKSVLREPILRRDEFDRRVDCTSAGLALDAQDEPVVVYRRRTAAQGPYDGTLHVARRKAPASWEIQTVHSSGNFGFWPLFAVDQDNVVREIMHFSFESFVLLRSTPHEDPSQEWTISQIGEVGDGFRLQGFRDPSGTWNALFRPNRFNADHSPHVFARWKGNDFQREQIPNVATIVEWIAQSSNNAPCLLVADRSLISRNLLRDARIMKRSPNGWETLARLPDLDQHPTTTTQFGIDRRDQLHLVQYHRQHNQLTWATQRDQHWHSEIISKSIPRVDSRRGAVVTKILFDKNNRPHVVVLRQEMPYGDCHHLVSP